MLLVPNHLLIIDEPESHLDTNNQILMARLLVPVCACGSEGPYHYPQ